MKEASPSTSGSMDGGGGSSFHQEEHEEPDEDEKDVESTEQIRRESSCSSEADNEKKPTNGKKKKKLSRKDRNRRKNISSVLKDEDLDEKTKDAKAQEADRLKRLQELQMRARLEQQHQQMLQASYPHSNGIYTKPEPFQIKSESDIINLVSTSGSENEDSKSTLNQSDDDVEVISVEKDEDNYEDPSNSGMHVDDRFNVPNENGRILVNIGHPKEDPDIFLTPQLEKVVKPHQIGGIRFLYDNIVESLSNYNSIGYGCILAHSMGLGKTIQVVSFTDVFLRHTPGKRVLNIVPINTIQNWLNEFDQWVPSSSVCSSSEEMEPRNYEVFILNDNCKNLDQRGRVIENWYEKGGVLLMGYELYRQLANKKPRKKRKRKGPECIDIEEEDKEKLTLDSVQSALVDPGPDLVICDEGHRIKNSHASISNALKALKTRRRVVLTGYPLQNNLMEYWCMVDFVRPNFLGTKNEFSNMFERPIQNGQCADSLPKDVRLMKHRAHVLHDQLKGFVQRRSHVVLTKSLPPKEEHVVMVRMTPLQRFLYNAFMKYLLGSNSVTNPLKAFAVALKIYNHPDVLYHFLRKREANTSLDLDWDFDEFGAAINPKNGKVPIPFKKEEISYDWANDSMENYESGLIHNSPKMVIFFALLRETIRENDRMLLFSQSLLNLDLIEVFLKQEMPELQYFRLDGGTSGLEREKLIKTFNSDDSIKLFLISTKAGSLGINLIGANRVVVFDASWNPCHDSQAVCRVYRYGQKKTSFIYRLIVDNSLERKIYDRQINKQGMANRIVDELNPELRFQTKEIQTLLRSDEEDPPLNAFTIDTSSTNDPVLSSIVRNNYDLLTCNPFTHESLLIDRGDQKLSKAEKRLAERSYQIEKKAKISYGRPSYSAFYPKTDLDYSKNTQWPHPSSSGSNDLNEIRSGGGGFRGGSSAPFGSPMRGAIPYPPPPQYNNSIPQTASPYPIPSSPITEFQRRMNPSLESQGMLSPSSFPTEALSRQGVTFKHLLVQNDLLIPTNIPDSPFIALKRGQKVMIIRTAKGIYIRMGDQIIKIKLPPELLKEVVKPSSSAEVVTLSDSDSEHNNTGGNLVTTETKHS